MVERPKLTPAQQDLAAQAAKLIPVCLKAFYFGFPCLRPVAELCDLESSAMLAVCKAARTYDPGKSGLSAYFSVAIKHACLREVQKEIKSQAHSHYRQPMQSVDLRVAKVVKTSNGEVFKAMNNGLTDTERQWIEEYVFDKTSFRAFGRKYGRDPRTAKRLLMSHLDKLRQLIAPEHGHG